MGENQPYTISHINFVDSTSAVSGHTGFIQASLNKIQGLFKEF